MSLAPGSHKQAKDLVYNVISYFKREVDADMPIHDAAKMQGVCM